MADQPEAPPKVYYRIRNWDDEFENSRSRQIKDLPWIRMNIVIRSEEYLWLMNHPNGVAHYGIFCALAQVAARCHPRGHLLRFDGTPHDFESLSQVTSITSVMCAEAVTRLTSVGWIESLPFTAHAFKGLRPVRVTSEASTHQHPERHASDSRNVTTVTPRDARARDGRGEENLSTPTPPFSKEGRVGSRNGTGKLKRSERLALEYAAEVEARKRKEKQNDV